MRNIYLGVQGTKIEQFIRFSMFSGLRTGEILSLSIDDYNTESNTLSIKNTMRNIRSDRNACYHLSSSPNARTIPLLGSAAAALRDAIDHQKEIVRCNCVPPPLDRRIFINSRGKPMTSFYITYQISLIKSLLTIDDDVTPEALRTNFAIMCYRNAWTDSTVIKYLGFRNASSAFLYKQIAASTSRIWEEHYNDLCNRITFR